METNTEKPKKLMGVKVLVVEDDEFFRQLLGKKLFESGAIVTVAVNGEEALNHVSDGGFDLIILDLLLPGIDGFEFLRRRQLNPKACNIPVMVLSNISDPEQVKTAQNYSVKAYLVKAAVSIAEIIDSAVKHVEKTSPNPAPSTPTN